MDHRPVQERLHTITECVESVSLNFDHRETAYVQGQGQALYIVVIARTSIDGYADPMGVNLWPVEECEVVDYDSFFEAARTVALNRDGAVVITVDRPVHEQMVPLKDLPETGDRTIEWSKNITYADWMGARHMSALETSIRGEVVTTISLSGETGRVTRSHDGEYTSNQRDELGDEWRRNE